jgi:hypothetical protein
MQAAKSWHRYDSAAGFAILLSLTSGRCFLRQREMRPVFVIIANVVVVTENSVRAEMQGFRSFVRSWCYHDELSFCSLFLTRRLQFSNPCRTAGGDPRASSPTHRSPKERASSFAPPALRPALVDLALAMVARLAP